MKTVLVAHASKYGATAEIAEKIGDVLRRGGLEVSVMPAGEVRDVKAYDAVVLGSGVYAGSWLKDAVTLLEQHEASLATKPVWFFSSGPTGEGDPVEIMKGWRFPEAQRAVAERIRPRDMALFHGSVDMNKLHFGEKLIIRAVRAKVGDFRDWEMIDTWARQIAASLQAAPP
jgi:menaquinone-dependent protoporphyrinogen oxidase